MPSSLCIFTTLYGHKKIFRNALTVVNDGEWSFLLVISMNYADAIFRKNFYDHSIRTSENMIV